MYIKGPTEWNALAVGFMYEFGIGVEQDSNISRKFYSNSVDLGNDMAKLRLKRLDEADSVLNAEHLSFFNCTTIDSTIIPEDKSLHISTSPFEQSEKSSANETSSSKNNHQTSYSQIAQKKLSSQRPVSTPFGGSHLVGINVRLQIRPQHLFKTLLIPHGQML